MCVCKILKQAVHRYLLTLGGQVQAHRPLGGQMQAHRPLGGQVQAHRPLGGQMWAPLCAGI